MFARSLLARQFYSAENMVNGFFIANTEKLHAQLNFVVTRSVS
jgi:hypothetical protein